MKISNWNEIKSDCSNVFEFYFFEFTIIKADGSFMAWCSSTQ